jgi:uncharacterized membrane protein
MKYLILFLSIIFASGMLFCNVYNSLIDSTSWGSNIPGSIVVAREYFTIINPGNFYRIFSPVNQLLALIALILFWKSYPSVRLYLGIAFVLYVLTDVITFAYFYPRNDILFGASLSSDTGVLSQTWSEWTSMNWIRSLILIIGLFFSCLSLHKIYTHSRS